MSAPSTTPASAQLATALVSPEVAKLLHKLQGQIIKEATAALAPAEFTLPAAPVYTRHTYSDRHTHRRIESSDAAGNSIALQTHHLAKPELPWIRPGLWYGDETRTDAQGRCWTRTLDSNYVMDDFGTLVEVPA
ncbi:hypothetical protein [Polaromonas jejuensis]|uniref:DUF3024 domain-containing protein n=1 Tax=Polaromonas jejuensis TaxID=457502 RepID=A0ABW0QGK2_9BURK|nr:hypothetical protein [Polaromonas jejuensis]